MTDIWIGVASTLAVLVGVPAILALVAGILRYAYDRGSDMVNVKPANLRDRSDRAGHASIMFVAKRVIRVFWVAGFGVYVVKQNNGERWGGESRLGAVRHSILTADNKWWKRKNGAADD